MYFSFFFCLIYTRYISYAQVLPLLYGRIFELHRNGIYAILSEGKIYRNKYIPGILGGAAGEGEGLSCACVWGGGWWGGRGGVYVVEGVGGRRRRWVRVKYSTCGRVKYRCNISRMNYNMRWMGAKSFYYIFSRQCYQ